MLKIIYLTVLLFVGFNLHADVFEQAALRVQDRAMYISDMNLYLKDISSFKCLKPKSILARAIGFKGKRIRSFNNKQVNIRKNQWLFEMVVDTVILSRFVQARERSKLPLYKNSRCYKSKLSQDLRGLLRTEIFLSDRFKHSGKRADIKTIKTFLTGLRKKTDYEIFY